jgi:subtilisin family serine protease
VSSRCAVLVLGTLPGLALALGDTAPTDGGAAPAAGGWSQSYPDQWGLARIGLDGSAAAQETLQETCPSPQPVVVAVVDSGIDYLHPDLPRERLWVNPQERLNGIDDDHDGFVDDVIGWNFVDDDNNPFDDSGHGTMIAGIIAAAGTRAPGINPHARIMALKVLNALGHGRSSAIAAGVDFATTHGARLINLSLGGNEPSALIAQAVARALAAGVLVVIAAGNEARETVAAGVPTSAGVLVVAATDTHDARAPFSNWGPAVGLAAPGVDILSLRARGSDLIALSGASAYRPGAAVVGEDGEYYRASGTSFAAAIVTGVASWVLACHPQLSGPQVARILTQSARDIGPPGLDPQTGYGLVDLRAALTADPSFFIESQISSASVVSMNGALQLRVSGSADASHFAKAVVRAAPESFPSDWIEMGGALMQPVHEGTLAQFDLRLMRGARRWLVQLMTQSETGQSREARLLVDLGSAP